VQAVFICANLRDPYLLNTDKGHAIFGHQKDGRDKHLIVLKCGNNKGSDVVSELPSYMAITCDT
jgi:hypothetical protein